MNKCFLPAATNRRVFHLAFHAKKWRTRKKNMKRLNRAGLLLLPQLPPGGKWMYGTGAGQFNLNPPYDHSHEMGLRF